MSDNVRVTESNPAVADQTRRDPLSNLSTSEATPGLKSTTESQTTARLDANETGLDTTSGAEIEFSQRGLQSSPIHYPEVFL